MNQAAIYHRPESEYAYLYDQDTMHIRLRTAKDDIQSVTVLKGDPYLIDSERWYRQEVPMQKIASTELFDYWQLVTTATFHRLQYGFHLVDSQGTELFYGDRGCFPFTEEHYQAANLYFRLPYFHEIDRFKAPEWVKETTWYQIFPERFANGDPSNDPMHTLAWGSQNPTATDFFGGDLQGVIDHLDYLVDLGVNGIYFCPIFKATSNHKYDTIDYYEIDPAFGDKKLFKELVDKAHQRGIRIMLDAVFNHVGNHSPQWQDVLKNQEQSRYKEWFHIHQFPVEANEDTQQNLSFDTFAFTPRMPKLNTANPEVQAYLLDIATYWIREFEIDAWRLDVANEVDHHFWKKFYQATTAIKSDFYILGEIWHSSQKWLEGDEFHGVMNYALTETITAFFVHRQLSAEQLIAGVNQQMMLYRQQTNQMMFNMLDSHDTARLLTLCAGNKELAKQVLAFTFLQMGSPCIYYGTEIGMDGGNDPDCRKCMVWESAQQDQVMYQFVQQLIAFRKQYLKVLVEGDFQWRYEQGLLILKRQVAEKLVVGVFNPSDQTIAYPKQSLNLTFANQDTEVNDEYLVAKNGFLLLTN